jgi:coatomer protein complex subunit alpha (xenin)
LLFLFSLSCLTYTFSFITAPKEEGGPKEGGKGWGEDDDLDLSDDEAPVVSSGKGQGGRSEGYFSAPTGGVPATVTWCADSAHAADHFAAGSVESALQLLKRQINLCDADRLKQYATTLPLGAIAYLPGLPLVPSNKSYLIREAAAQTGKSVKTLPALSLKVANLLDQLKQSYRAFTNGQFAECRNSLDVIITSIPLTHASSRTETIDLKELMDMGREYITAIRVKAAITESVSDIPRTLELAAYFTHCNLQPAHLMLALKTAMASGKISYRYHSYHYSQCDRLFVLFKGALIVVLIYILMYSHYS